MPRFVNLSNSSVQTDCSSQATVKVQSLIALNDTNDRNSMFKCRISGYHTTWLHNECCCVRFSKSDVRPSAGFSARNHIGRRAETRLSDKGSECLVRYLPLPARPHLLYKNASPLHTNGSRGSEQKKCAFCSELKWQCTCNLCSVHQNFACNI